MQLVPNFLNERLRKSLRSRLEQGRMPLMRPAVWKLSGLLPRFRDRRSLLWRVNEIELTDCPVDELSPIWPKVLSGSSWAIPAGAIRWLWGVLERLRPERILELGSGVSTLVFATYSNLYPDRHVRVASLDHEPDWVEQLSVELQARELDQQVQVIHAPIVAWEPIAPQLQTYSPKRVRQAIQQLGGEVDLVLIDGPPAHLYGRNGTLPTVMGGLSQRGVVGRRCLPTSRVRTLPRVGSTVWFTPSLARNRSCRPWGRCLHETRCRIWHALSETCVHDGKAKTAADRIR